MIAIVDILTGNAHIPPIGEIVFLSVAFAAFCLFCLLSQKKKNEGKKNDNS